MSLANRRKNAENMKIRIIITLLIITINYTFSQEKVIKSKGIETIKVDNTESGKVENGIYTCNKFDWSIKIPENYTITNVKEIQQLEEKGNSEIKKNIPKNTFIEKRIHLIGFNLNSKNTFSAGLNLLDKTKKVTLEEHKKTTTELLKKTFSKIENARFEFEVTDIKIGKYKFYKIKVDAYNKSNNQLVLTQIYYNSFVKNYLLGVLINYNNINEGKLLEENFINSMEK